MGPVAKRMGLSSHLCRAFLLPLGAAIIMASCSAANPVSALKTCQTHEMSAEFRMGHNSRNLPAFGFAPTFTKALSGSSIEKAASPVRAMRSRPLGGLRAQLPNPFATFFGNEQTKDRQYHESRLSHHEERIKYHEERARYHRANLQNLAREVTSGVFEEKIALKAQQEGRPVRVLFVDLSNTCRSPAAEAIMQNMVKEDRLSLKVEASSVSTGSGTRDWYKEDIAADIEIESSDPRMVSHASKRGLNLAGRRSRAMTREDLIGADIIIGMDAQNKKDIVQAASYWGLKGEAEGKIRMLSNYCRSGTRTTEVPDPYYGGKGGQASGQVFEKVLDLLEDGCRGLLSDLAPPRQRL